MTDYDVWVCTDCYFTHHYGSPSDDPDYTPDREPLTLLPDGLHVADATCSNHDWEAIEDEEYCHHCGGGDYEDGIDAFSWRSCDGCGSTLGGARYRLTVFS